MTFDPQYVYLGDRLTDPQLRGLPVMAVRRDGKCVRGRNGNMLIVDSHGCERVVLGRLLAKRKIPPLRKIEEEGRL